MPTKKSNRISAYQALKQCGLLKNLTEVAAGYRAAGLPGLATLVCGVRDDAQPGMTLSDMWEFQDKAHTICTVAIFTLADLGFAKWVKRREAHLKKMEASPASPVQTPREARAWTKLIADIRATMRFADGVPVRATRTKKTGKTAKTVKKAV